MSQERRAVTGAFGFSGKYIAQKLLDRGQSVITLTGSPNRPDPFGGRVAVVPLAFDRPQQLAESLAGTKVLYNTYWVRFNHKTFTYLQAEENTKRLFDAARAAGVQRIVHVSITNPSEDSPHPYFQGKARLERYLKESGVSYAILRPAVLFGEEDILINNIAWALRRLPVFGVFGDGSYRLRPIFVEDLAELAVREGEETRNAVIDAVGPESFTYRELVAMIGRAIGRPRPILPIPPALGFLVGRILGYLMKDELITRDEIEGLMEGLLDTPAPAAGSTRLSDWTRARGDRLGRRYANELSRRLDRARAY
jgi:NADH dehydrogenase